MAKIPKEAKRVFKGIIFDVYQWPLKVYDGSTETFEALKRPDAAIVVGITPDGQVMMVDDSQPQRPMVVTLPGGRVDGDESPLAAAKRELLEETGYASEQWEEWLSYEPEEKVDMTVHYFLARNLKKVGRQNLDAGEMISPHPVSIAQFLDGIASGTYNAYGLGTRILIDLVAGKRAELEAFLSGSGERPKN